MKDRIITIMCHAKNQICNMNRFVLILLLSLFNFAEVCALSNTSQRSSCPIRTVNKSIISVGGGVSSVGVTTNMYRQVTTTQSRVSSNAFSAIPSMQVNMRPPSASKYSQSLLMTSEDETTEAPRKIRGQSRAVGEGDEGEEEPETKDPFSPIGEGLIPLLILAVGYIINIARRKRTLEATMQ